VEKKSDKERMDEFIEAIVQVAQGNYLVQLELSEENNMFDSLAMGLNMMIDDIRERVGIELQNERYKRINEELRMAKEKAEESDRLKSAFLANMSHEIRTPMNGILGFAALLKKPDLSSELREKYLKIIEESGERMLNVINDLIEISKIEAGQMSVTLTPTHVNEQLEFIYSFFRPEVEKKGLKLFYDPELLENEAIIETDREKLYAVLINLVKNAIKYTHMGHIEFGYSKKENYLEFYVKDTGIGISFDKKMEIFNRFVQADEGLTRRYDGAGLGLAISKAYVEMLGGKIWVESEIGTGSKFFFTIPCGSRHETNELSFRMASSGRSNLKRKINVLIAEDDLVTILLLDTMMEDFVNNMIHVDNGVDAVATCLENSEIDLVLMDIKMSRMDGYEAVRQIRKFNKDVVIIAQTAFALAGERVKALEAGCNDYIPKPLYQNDLIAIIEKNLKP
jgi:signal transduction histidine kinase/CheY-like chemotaxis protein